MSDNHKADWHKTACVLCSNNCGIEVRLDDREITRVRGNKSHVGSKGYTCEKALRVNHYQNAKTRLTSPLRREPDGSFTEIGWDQAISGVAAALSGVADRHGGNSILYYGGGGQGNHLLGAYGAATSRALGTNRRSNALAQEKTGEAWVEGRMFGAHTHGEFAETEVAVFLGKNPWHSHGFDQTRRVLKAMANDDSRTLVVIDPRRTETADLADMWLAVKPGTDAWLLSALAAVLIRDNLIDRADLDANVTGLNQTIECLSRVPIDRFAEICGIGMEAITGLAHRLATARSVAVYEDLGIEMAPHSTLVSYLQRVVWVLVGAYGVEGGMSAHTSMVSLFNYRTSGREPVDAASGGSVISGLIPCNLIADEVLSDHSERTRAMFIESANPVHSLADSDKFRKAMRACETTVVIDVAMTETAQMADYVLPASSQYEKVETTFFSAAFPDNWFCIRPPILAPLEGTLPEPEIHSRLVEALGAISDCDLEPLRQAASEGLDQFAEAFTAAVAAKPALGAVGAIVLYRTLGRSLPDALAGAAPLWFSAQQVAMRHPAAVRRAGFAGDGPELGNALWEALITEPDGVVFTRNEIHDAWALLGTPDQKINIAIDELLAAVDGLRTTDPDLTTEEFPFVLSAGERRAFTANTIMRDPAWRKRDQQGALRLSPIDADQLGVMSGDRVRITTKGGTAVAVAERNDTMMPGHLSIPNGLGLSYSPAGGEPEVTGVPPNELTTTDWADPIAGTPWHKYVPARLERVDR